MWCGIGIEFTLERTFSLNDLISGATDAGDVNADTIIPVTNPLTAVSTSSTVASASIALVVGLFDLHTVAKWLFREHLAHAFPYALHCLALFLLKDPCWERPQPEHFLSLCFWGTSFPDIAATLRGGAFWRADSSADTYSTSVGKSLTLPTMAWVRTFSFIS